MRVGGQRHAPAVYRRESDPMPIAQEAGGPQGPSSWVYNISPPLGFDSQTVQAIASCYTDYVIPAHGRNKYGF